MHFRLSEIEMVRFTIRITSEIVTIPRSEIALTTITLDNAQVHVTGIACEISGQSLL
jgi:hypothetical protein